MKNSDIPLEQNPWQSFYQKPSRSWSTTVAKLRCPAKNSVPLASIKWQENHTKLPITN
jgi:hypothetical protein